MRNQRDEPSNATSFDAVNFTEDYDYDCNTATTADDAFATYLRDLAAKGQLNATVAA
jgi:esterase/lipase superfamily enzyme